MCAADLRVAKREVLIGLADRLQGLSVHGIPLLPRRRQDDLRLQGQARDGTLVEIHIATAKEGLPPGQFSLWPTASVRGGPVRRWLDGLPLRGSHLDRLGAVALTTGSIGPTGLLSFKVGDPARSTGPGKAARLIRDSFIPFMAGFVGEWSNGVASCLAWPELVARPFSTAVMLAALADGGLDPSLLAEIRAQASANPRFWDYREPVGPDELVGRIRVLVAHGMA